MGLKIVSWNVNGLRSVLRKDFHSFAEIISGDIVCLQEIRVSQDLLPVLNFPGYAFRSFNCAEKRGYSGTATLAKIHPLHEEKSLSVEKLFTNHEGRVQFMEFKEFSLVNVYVPNAQRDLARLSFRRDFWDPEFGKFLRTYSQRKPLIICGDFNVAHQAIDLARPKENCRNAGFTDEERNGFSEILGDEFVDIFRVLHPEEKNHYTWWSNRMNARERNVGWRIDYFLISKVLIGNITRCEILHQIMGSDHAPILLELK